MNNSENWSILEKLADSNTSSEERLELLKRVESDPVLLNRWKAFRVLQTWPELANLGSSSNSVDGIIESIEENESVDAGIKRAFPYVAAIALAASIILAFVNIGQRDNASEITLDDVFGLPTPTIEDTLLANL